MGFLATAAVIGGLPQTAAAATATGRWYTDEQVLQGSRVFALNCAKCHGEKAAGLSKAWREPDSDGNYPAPPLDGSAHAWHHPLPQLRQTIRKGGVSLGGTMPAFGDKLSEGQIDAAIAWIQSHWSDEIYAAWQDRGAPQMSASRPAAEKNQGPLVHLRKLLPQGTSLGEPEKTPAPGILQVQVGGEVLYLLENGRYALTGDLIDLASGTNLSEKQRAQTRLAAIARQFPPEKRIVYRAKGREKRRLVVFTDTTCPYCRRLHGELPQLQSAGVAVHYVPFPRGGPDSEGAAQMRGVWCAEDRRKAFDQAAGAAPGSPPERLECPAAEAVTSGYGLGQQLGVTGTPAIVLPEGGMISGYRTAKQLLQVLGLGG